MASHQGCRVKRPFPSAAPRGSDAARRRESRDTIMFVIVREDLFSMDYVRYALLVAHFIGLAAILGPFLDQWRADVKRVTQTMVWGARAQLLTGLLLVGVAEMNDYDVDHAKIAVKLVVAVAVAGVAEVGAKRTKALSAESSAGGVTTFWWLVGALTVVNIIVAVVWR